MYRCQVQNLVIDSIKSSLVSFAIGNHLQYYGNHDVIAFHADHKIIHYFPRGLEITFPNIEIVYIYHSGLKQITQYDLKSLKNLVVLDLWGNDIQIIPEGLFENNPKLKHISFTDNRLTFIHPEVFNKLDGLVNLFLDTTKDFYWNSCDNIRIESNRNAVLNAIRELNPKCYS